MTHVLITGGAGFIGSNLAHKLDQMGWHVDIVDDLSSGFLENLQGLSTRCINADILHIYEHDYEKLDDKKHIVILGDFTHKNVLKRIIVGTYDYVFHFASSPHVLHSIDYPTQSAETNLFKSIELFRVCADAKVKRVIFASSSSVYNKNTSLPMNESCTILPSTPHGLHKLQCEQHIDLYTNLYDLDAVSLRFFGVYGPRQLSNSGYSTAVPSWCHSICANNELIFEGDGTQARDMIYIDDAIDACIRSALYTKKNLHAVYNIGTGTTQSNNSILWQLYSHYGNNIRVHKVPLNKYDCAYTCADTMLAWKELGFTYKTAFSEGLQKTLDWWDSVPPYLLNKGN